MARAPGSPTFVMRLRPAFAFESTGDTPRRESKRRLLCKLLEARGGIEPPNKGFADLCLTTWLPRRSEGLSSPHDSTIASRIVRAVRSM